MEEWRVIDEDTSIGPNIGRGVFQGKYRRVDVALKVLDPSERRRREIDILSNLQKHPNIVEYFTSRVDNKPPPTWYVITELCHPLNLYDIIRSNEELKEEAKMIILRHVTEGLKHLHENNIIHRDIKPQNILLSRDGQYVKICDFGLSKQVETEQETVTKSLSLIGTRGWWSPESFDGGKMSRSSDIFSLGLVFFFVLSNGKLLLTAVELLKGRPSQLDYKWDSLSEGTADNTRKLAIHLIKPMVNVEYHDRPSIHEVLSHPLFWNDDKKLAFLRNLGQIISYKAKSLVASQDSSYFSSESNSAKADYHNLELAERADVDQCQGGSVEEITTTIKASVDNFLEGTETKFQSKGEMWNDFFTLNSQLVFDGVEIIKELPHSKFSQFKEPNLSKSKLLPQPKKVVISRCDVEGHTMTVEWAKVPFNEEYSIVVDRVDIDEKKIFKTSENMIIINTLVHSATYTIQVYAQNAQGMSGKPSARIEKSTPPPEPKDVRAEISSSGITVRWRDPEQDTRVTYFIKVLRNNSFLYEVECERCRHFLESPKPSTHYEFIVFGKSASELSGEHVSTSVVTAPARIVSLKATFTPKPRAIRITWKKAEDDDVQYMVSIFRDSVKLGNGPLVETEELCTITKIEPSCEYHAEVWAVNKEGKEGQKAESTKVYTPPLKLENVTVAEVEGRFIIEWSMMVKNKYCIQVLCDEEKFGSIQTPQEAKYIFASAERSKFYHFDVWARSIHGIDGEVTRRGPFTLGPCPVEEVTTTQIGKDIEVSWRKDDHHDKSHSYIIQAYCNGSPSGDEKTTYKTTITFTKLRLQKNYFFRVWASANGKRSTAIESPITTIYHEPGDLPGLETNTSVSGIYVFWPSVFDDIARYKVTFSRMRGAETIGEKKVTYVNECAYNFTDCYPSAEYKIEVQAMDSDDICIVRDEKMETAPPSIVQNCDIKEIEGVFHLQWDQEEMVKKFKVESYGNGRCERTEIVVFPSYLYTPRKVDYSTRYFFKISAINHKGYYGPPLRTPSITRAPPAVSKLEAILFDNRIKISWIMKPIPVTYRVEIKPEGEDPDEVVETEEMQYEIDNIKPSTKYKFTVWATSVSNIEGEKTEVECCSRPSRPRSVRTRYEDGILLLFWEMPIDETPDFYQIGTVKDGKDINQTKQTHGKSIFVDWVRPSREYSFKVSAVKHSVIGTSTKSEFVKSPPSPIQKIDANLVNGEIRFKWVPQVSASAEQYCYQIFCDNEARGDTVNTNKPCATTKAKPSRAYHITVWGIDDSGLCGQRKISTEVFTPPGNVKILQTTSSDGEIRATWSPLGEGTKYHVQVYCNGFPAGDPQTVHECSFSEKAASSKYYYFTIWAENKYGIEGPTSLTSTIETAPSHAPSNMETDSTAGLVENEPDDTNRALNFLRRFACRQ